MREDMPKCLVEDGRRSAACERHYRRRQRRRDKSADGTELPKRESMSGSRQFGYRQKELNETLNPLIAFLRRSVGRRWDDVYSEIRGVINTNNAVQMHIMDHLWVYVDRNVRVSDCGKLVEPSLHKMIGPYEVNGRPGWKASETYDPDSFFIHPVDGTLRRKARRKFPSRKNENTGRLFVEGRVYVRDMGIWYEHVIEPLPPGVRWGTTYSSAARGEAVIDVLFGDVRDLGAMRAAAKFFGTTDLHGYVSQRRRQLSGRELRQLGVQNDR